MSSKALLMFRIVTIISAVVIVVSLISIPVAILNHKNVVFSIVIFVVVTLASAVKQYLTYRM